MLIGIVLILLVVHLAFAAAIYVDAIKQPRLYVLPFVWFLATLLFGVFAVVAYNTSKQHH